jgi:hypothetical protein
MEEGSVLRRPTSETTNSLSVFDRVRTILGIFFWRWPSGSRLVILVTWTGFYAANASFARRESLRLIVVKLAPDSR